MVRITPILFKPPGVIKHNRKLILSTVNTTVGYGFNQTSMGWNFLDYPDGWPVATYNRPSTSSSSYFW